jgi:hypothetical protein
VAALAPGLAALLAAAGGSKGGVGGDPEGAVLPLPPEALTAWPATARTARAALAVEEEEESRAEAAAL